MAVSREAQQSVLQIVSAQLRLTVLRLELLTVEEGVVVIYSHRPMTAAPEVAAPGKEADGQYAVWRHGGRKCVVTPAQAAVLEMLAQARDDGLPDVSQELLIGASGQKCRKLVDLFARCEAWSWVEQSRPGFYRLKEV